ncbi:DinB family protein [Hymenobacter psoromatis]|uniref:DinB family protein n=1 Tax=Hymenobacter psoromatis TaxID=1484116 RepID=UPI001CBB0134|nr:DinB family protein [Hymenobacter psoromatis]
MPKTLPEVWLRGPLPAVPPLLQPVAHALLQARAEVADIMAGFPADKLAARPLGLASVGFHLRHLAGVLDRTFTYARGQALSETQLAYLAAEGQPPTHPGAAQELLRAFDQQVDKALMQLQNTPEASLPDWRGVGRAQLPSTVIGLLVHAAEHTTRHVGQLLVTARLVRSTAASNY